jgi:hypothetical protein
VADVNSLHQGHELLVRMHGEKRLASSATLPGLNAGPCIQHERNDVATARTGAIEFMAEASLLLVGQRIAGEAIIEEWDWLGVQASILLSCYRWETSCSEGFNGRLDQRLTVPEYSAIPVPHDVLDAIGFPDVSALHE